MECSRETGAWVNFDNRCNMRQYSGLAPLLCFGTLLIVAGIGMVVYAADRQGFLDRLLHGREVFERHCLECHGADGRGTGKMAAACPSGRPT